MFLGNVWNFFVEMNCVANKFIYFSDWITKKGLWKRVLMLDEVLIPSLNHYIAHWLGHQAVLVETRLIYYHRLKCIVVASDSQDCHKLCVLNEWLMVHVGMEMGLHCEMWHVTCWHGGMLALCKTLKTEEINKTQLSDFEFGKCWSQQWKKDIKANVKDKLITQSNRNTHGGMCRTAGRII